MRKVKLIVHETYQGKRKSEDVFAACVVMIFAISVVILPAFLRAWRNVCDDIINAMERSFDMMYGVARQSAITLASRAKDIYFQVCNSLAREKTLNYRHYTEVHHIVAQRAINAKQARNVLDNVPM